MEKDVNVDFHFTPPFSYRTADFKPVSLDVDNTMHYNIPSFHKKDERFCGIMTTLRLQHATSEVDTKDILNYLHQVTISITIRDKSGNTIVHEKAQLNDLYHKETDNGIIEFRLSSGGSFSVKLPNTVELSTVTQNPQKNLTGLTLALRLTERRGK